MQESNYNYRSKTVWYVLLGALVCGLLWRIRGTHGWGGETGIFNVGVLFTMFLVIITGGNAKTSPERIALTALAFTFSTPAWGTFLNQVKGVISAGPDNMIYGISPISGVVMMLLLGFSISGIYGILLGSMFSESKWKLVHFLGLVATFYGVTYLCRATVCHPIMSVFQPPAVEAFNESLVNSGITDGVYKTYMAHFNNLSWSRSFIGGRNYFASVYTVSMAIATCVCLLLTRYWILDKRSARVGLLSAFSFAFAITFSDLFFVIFGDTGKPALIETEHVHAWECWEYFTGFFAGGLLTYIILKNKADLVEKDGCFGFVPEKIRALIGFLIVAAALAYCIILPVSTRYDLSEYRSMIVFVVSLLSFFAIVYSGIKTRFGMDAPDYVSFCKWVFLVLLLIQGLIYFFAPGHHANYKNILDLEHCITLVSLLLAITFGIKQIAK